MVQNGCFIEAKSTIKIETEFQDRPEIISFQVQPGQPASLIRPAQAPVALPAQAARPPRAGSDHRQAPRPHLACIIHEAILLSFGISPDSHDEHRALAGLVIFAY